MCHPDIGNVGTPDLIRLCDRQFLQEIWVYLMLSAWSACIRREFQMEKYSSISSVIERMKKQMLTDSTLKRRVDKVAEKVSKSQEQT